MPLREPIWRLHLWKHAHFKNKYYVIKSSDNQLNGLYKKTPTIWHLPFTPFKPGSYKLEMEYGNFTVKFLNNNKDHEVIHEGVGSWYIEELIGAEKFKNFKVAGYMIETST